MRGRGLHSGVIFALSGLCVCLISFSLYAEPPVAVPDGVSTLEETPVTFNVLDNDFDPDNDRIRFVRHTEPFFGTVECASGICTYTPAKDFVGDDAFTYTISTVDGTATAQVGIEVNDVNDAPVARDDSAETLEDRSVTLNILSNDSDIEGDSIRITRFPVPNNGTMECDEDGNCTYTPNADFHGVDSFSYSIADHRGAGDAAIITITVIEVSEPPKPADDEVSILVDESVTINILANDVEPDGDPFGLSDYTQAANGTVDCVIPIPEDENQNTRCTYTPNAGFVGEDRFSYTVQDDNGLSASAEVIIQVIRPNEPPVAEANGPYSCEVGDVITLSSSGSSDPDGSISSYEWSFGSTEPNASYSCDASGTVSVTLVVTDDAGATASDTAEINIAVPNSAPTANANGPYECEVGDVITLSSAGSSDSDGTITSYEWSFGSTEPNPSYACDADGTVSVTLTVTDDDGATATSTTQITITPLPNELPIADAGGPYSCEVGETLILSAMGSSDPDGSIISYQWSFGSTEPMPTFTCNTEGIFDISLTVTDDEGASASDSTSISVTVAPNEPPVADAGGPYNCLPGETITLSASGSYDLDGEIVSYQWSFGATGPVVDYTCDASGTFSFSLLVTDDRGATATESFSILVEDNSGWDKSSLSFVGVASASCAGGGVVITASITNTGDKDMTGSSSYEVWYRDKGNPKNGQLIGTEIIPPIAAGQTITIQFEVSEAGNYKFKAYQRPGHPGQGVLWSETADVDEDQCG